MTANSPVVPGAAGPATPAARFPSRAAWSVALDRLDARPVVRTRTGGGAELEAGLTTATVDRLARENGLLFPT